MVSLYEIPAIVIKKKIMNDAISSKTLQHFQSKD